MLSDYGRPFYNDLLLPAGNLRESRKNAKRADVVIVTKCPDNISDKETDHIINSISKYTRENVPVFFVSIKYGAPVPVFRKSYEMPWMV